MIDSSHQRKASIPTYPELFDTLAGGFGLLAAKERALGFQRSWQGRQARYSPKIDMPWRSDNRGLVGELVFHLSGGDMSIADEIGEYLHNVESLLLCFRYRPLFTTKSYRFGLAIFLGCLAFPQIALLLSRMSNRLPESSPLYYIRALLPEKDQENYDCSKITRNLIKSILDELHGVNTADFRITLSKISSRSSVKLETIEKQINEIKLQVAGKENECDLLRGIDKARAAYIAGMAIQRFLKYLSNESQNANSAGFLGCISYYIEEFNNPTLDPSLASLYEAHNTLYNDHLKTGEFYPLTLNYDNPSLAFLIGVYESNLQCKYPRNVTTLKAAYSLFDRSLLCPKELKSLISLFEQQDDYNVFRVCTVHLNALLYLAQADNEKALICFKSLLSFCAERQLGELAVTAAQHAIALELMRPGKWVNGCLDPYIPYIAQNSRQTIDFEIGMPTPFEDFSDSPQISDSIKLIMESVLLFNNTRLPTVKNTLRQLCNPLALLNEKLDKFFSKFDDLISCEISVTDAIDRATTITFNSTIKARSVLRIGSAKPYEVIRDIFYYTNKFFGIDGIFVHEHLNPAIYRYINFPHQNQLRLLSALDKSAYERDLQRQI